MDEKVTLIKCQNYNFEKVYKAVQEGINLLGGISNFINKEDKVLIKPNLLSARYPEEGVDTHPVVVKAVIKMAKKATHNIWLGDSPGGGVRVDKVYEVSGIRKVAQEEKVELVRFDQTEVIHNIPIAKIPLQADKIISIPKFKTHELTTLTGAIKNMFGIVTGLGKSECHRQAPGIKEFAPLLVDIFSLAQPCLSIVDGVIGMEGDGPENGILKNLGLILASSDAVALDAVMSVIMGLDPFQILTTQIAHQRKLGVGDLSQVKIEGESLKEVIAKDFKLPTTSLLTKIPGGVLSGLARLVRFRPKIDTDKCTGCEVCVKGCPVKAMSLKRDKIRINYSECICCFCCLEFCSHGAVKVEKNFLARAFL